MDNINIINDDEIKLTPQQRANKQYYEKLKIIQNIKQDLKLINIENK